MKSQGVESLIDNVLDDIEAYELEQEELGVKPEITQLKEDVLQTLSGIDTDSETLPPSESTKKLSNDKSIPSKKSSSTPKHKVTTKGISTSIEHKIADHTPTLPLSTTKPAMDTKIAFITHYKHSQPQVTVQPISKNTYTVVGKKPYKPETGTCNVQIQHQAKTSRSECNINCLAPIHFIPGNHCLF